MIHHKNQPVIENLSCTLPAIEAGEPHQNGKRPTTMPAIPADNCKALVPIASSGFASPEPVGVKVSYSNSLPQKVGCSFRSNTNYIIPIILPNTIHQCRKKNL